MVAVSGGVDSMVLLHVLHELSREESWKLTVAHLNHQLRGRASESDERLVRDTVRKLGLPFVVDRGDVRKFARKQKVSLEMAARKLRHDFLAREAVRLDSHTVALAHHADDQLELFFIRLLRGSGGEGLAGMKWSSPSPSNRQVVLVRPLLDLPKKDLTDFATKNDIRFREDASNHSLEFQRNRVRHELLPLLRKHYQKSLDKVILRVSEIVGAEAEFTTQCALNWLERMENLKRRRPRSDGYVFRATNRYTQCPVGLQRRIIQLQSLKLGLPLDFEMVENLRLNPDRCLNVSAINTVPVYLLREISGRIRISTPAKADFQPDSQEVLLSNNSGRIVFDGLSIQWRKQLGNVSHESLLTPTPSHRMGGGRDTEVRFMEGEQVRKKQGVSHELPSPQPSPIGWGREKTPNSSSWRQYPSNNVQALAGPVPQGVTESSHPNPPRRGRKQENFERANSCGLGAGSCGEYFDADKVGSSILVRHWRAGDRFNPIGSQHLIKLQDFFTNEKVPRDKRRHLAIGVAENGEIFWVEGLRISEHFKVSKTTKRIIEWSWIR